MIDSKKNVEPDLVVSGLQKALRSYLDESSRRSLNALSKRCAVSEPTLRRILKGQVKTVPNPSTVLDVLTTISGEKSSKKIAEMFPGPLANFIQEMFPHMEEREISYDPELNQELKNATAYVLYKLAANGAGLRQSKVTELFGTHGKIILERLTGKKLVVESGGVYRAVSRNFAGSQVDFISNFKTLSDFLKTRTDAARVNLNPLLVNYSESVSENAYREIIGIQKTALKKIRGVLGDKSNEGTIPILILLGIDTLDNQTAAEISAKEKGSATK